LAVGLIILFKVNNFWLQLLNAVYLGFVSTQIGLLGHDIGHQQVFRTGWKSTVAGFLVGNLLVGWSWNWWVEKHNGHHGYPNQLVLDPDIVRPLTVFTEEAAHSVRGFGRFMVKYQAYFEFPTYAFAPLTFLILSIHSLFLKKAKHPLIEALLLAAHYLLYAGLLLLRLNIWQAILFMIIHGVFFGLYLGRSSPPTIKGCSFWTKTARWTFSADRCLRPALSRVRSWSTSGMAG